MNALMQVRLNQFHEESTKCLILYFTLLEENKGRYCKKCKIIQGQSHEGYQVYYCDCLSNRIQRKLKEKNKHALGFLLQSLDIMKEKIGVKS